MTEEEDDGGNGKWLESTDSKEIERVMRGEYQGMGGVGKVEVRSGE